jgi:multiple sugar transport system ATP-binding protein
MASISLKSVYKNYGATTVIKNLNLEVRDGEFMVLVGPSGCGKSTILRMIAGLDEISAGELCIDEKVVNHLSPKDRDIAIVFQNYALYPHMTVFENLAFGLKIRGVDKAIIREKVNNVANTLEITDLLQRKPKDMSGGQRQRVAIGRAIVRDPKVFLFDEPLSNLDAKLRTQMRLEIAELHKKLKTTIVYVTHDQVEAMTLGDRIAVMHQGEISQLGTPKELYKNPANKFVAGFIGSPAMNFIAGRIFFENNKMFFHDDAENIKIPLQDIASHQSNDEVTLGCRPEQIVIHTNQTLAAHCIATITHMEHMGFESFVYVRVGNQYLTIRSTQSEAFTEGMAVWCELVGNYIF